MATLQQKKQAIINALKNELTKQLDKTPNDMIETLYKRVTNKKPIL